MSANFLDTFVLVEYLRGNAAAKPFLASDVATTILNLCELAYWGLVHGEEKATDRLFRSLEPAVLEIPTEIVQVAMRWRRERRSEGRDLSYIDVIGYWVARYHGMDFVTSAEFEGVEGAVIVPQRE